MERDFGAAVPGREGILRVERRTRWISGDLEVDACVGHGPDVFLRQDDAQRARLARMEDQVSLADGRQAVAGSIRGTPPLGIAAARDGGKARRGSQETSDGHGPMVPDRRSVAHRSVA